MSPGPLSFVFRQGWPNQSIDRLLRAAVLEDVVAAAEAWRAFEAAADFDHLTAGEMRLIGMAAKRLPDFALDSPMLARIGGIERANWARSQLTIGAAGDGLRALEAASIDMLVIKGAGRFATGDLASRGRMLNDVDIVVRPADMTRAFDLLIDAGWQPAGSGTVLFQRSRVNQAVGINLVRGRFGNLDLHRTPYHPPYASTANETSIWDRAKAGRLGYVPLWVPSATDAVTIAIAHGALDAHKSSDWLADIAAAIDAGVDWDLLETLIGNCRMYAPAAVALGYVRDRLARPVPGPLLARLEGAAVRRPLVTLGALAETRPKSTRIGFFWVVRAVAKQARLLRGRPRSSRSRIVLPSPALVRPRPEPGPMTLKAPLALPDRQHAQPWSGTVDLTILVTLPPASRRVDFEINSQGRNLARLRALVVNRGARERLFRFKMPIALMPEDISLELVAAPSRSFNDAPAEVIARYGATPFRVVKFQSKRL